ncbi:2-alkenal reductase [Thermobaculum terrenum ATCC BAA-798]|uniref:2-alkenal reductase n=1 Tax=Thermobaculum terrenum (strain ATCC BAA-798 / CCMEE 7001 / YNP1) TaxID=525904 RepID=D1CEU6_THET1|nr:trypsin-like peptidase domain-containing protein [Thermobaculum terrenum]ACZ41452.1 2-alkenal reductase [Thermobaculum terrenum ATCC BAA-798]
MKGSIRRLLLVLVMLPLLAACQFAPATTGSTTVTPTATSVASTNTSSSSNGSTGNQLYSLTSATLNVPQLVQEVKDGVVEIIAQQTSDGSYIRGISQGYATGSGFIIDTQGHILTNNHVIEGADKITVVLPDNRILSARLVGADPTTDLAVLKVEASNLKPLRLGDSSKLQVGEPVVAIGNALGLPGGPTVTTGVVSALNRSEEEPISEQPGYYPGITQTGNSLFGLIQTDAAVNPGNSGGPLLNMQGEVVGINTLGQRSTESGVTVEGINFAIPINTAKRVADEIIRTGKVVYPYIGIRTQFLYPEVSVIENLPHVLGQYVASVEPGTPAEKAGLRRGDIIIAIDGQRITNESMFVELLREHKPGDKITLTIRRDGRTITKEVTLTERPSSLSG